ncbi:hypothetical protein LY474_02410 [Myxococcus stipitatus]|uniref:hypothetical protein n=1 Tax=Myxococcus stipitatus TaxID=83455 RepID=UPI001F40389C|nr:hypothetical protein [Myxococcus stipitatus]MCE9666654.1 hypothetical protein [Myxococcus stipitatus]
MPVGRVRQFVHGLSLPYHVARAVLADPVARRQYLRVALLQTVAALALALTCMGSAREAALKPKEDAETRKEAEAALAEGLEEIANVVAQETDDPPKKAKLPELARLLQESGVARGKAERILEQRGQERGAENDRAQRAVAQRVRERQAASDAAPNALAQRVQERHAESDRAASALEQRVRESHAESDKAASALERRVRESQAAQERARRILERTRTAEDDASPASATAEEKPAAPAEAPGETSSASTDAAPATTNAPGNEGAHASESLDAIDDPDHQKLSPAMRQRIRDLQSAAKEGKDGRSVAQALAALLMELDQGEEPPGPGEPPAVNEASADAPSKPDVRTPPSSRPPRIRVNVDTDDEDDDDKGWFARRFSYGIVAFWVALFAALQLAQWVVIALSRDYHDVITRDASLLTGVEPEDEPIQPRVRVNFEWLQKKVRRRWRAMILFAVGVPAVTFLAAPFFCVGLSSPVFTTLSSLWGAWWLVVFTAAKSARAWEPLEPQRAPWFLRAWTWLTTRVPGLRWVVLQRYGTAWNKRSAELFAPIASVERHPYAYAGLALVRFVGSFAPLKFFVRPLIPVASAHILELEHQARQKAAQARDEAPSGTPAPGHGGTEEAIRIG